MANFFRIKNTPIAKVKPPVPITPLPCPPPPAIPTTPATPTTACPATNPIPAPPLQKAINWKTIIGFSLFTIIILPVIYFVIDPITGCKDKNIVWALSAIIYILLAGIIKAVTGDALPTEGLGTATFLVCSLLLLVICARGCVDFNKKEDEEAKKVCQRETIEDVKYVHSSSFYTFHDIKPYEKINQKYSVAEGIDCHISTEKLGDNFFLIYEDGIPIPINGNKKGYEKKGTFSIMNGAHTTTFQVDFVKK